MSKLPVVSTLVLLGSLAITNSSFADGNLQNVHHIVIVMQENHSFDNYFGVLAYAPGSPYHNGNGACSATDHTCVDGLKCSFNGSGVLTCINSNLDDNGSTVSAFHSPTRCVAPDLDHSWVGTHHEINFENPNSTLSSPLSDGFVRQNDLTEQIRRELGGGSEHLLLHAGRSALLLRSREKVCYHRPSVRFGPGPDVP